MTVYIIRDEGTGRVKIGMTNNVVQRLMTLQCASPSKLTLIREIDGGRRAEQWMHERFSSLRTVGEWFEFDREMLSVEPPHMPKPKSMEQTTGESDAVGVRVAEWLRATFPANGARITARMFGVSPHTTKRWFLGTRPDGAHFDKMVSVWGFEFLAFVYPDAFQDAQSNTETGAMLNEIEQIIDRLSANVKARKYACQGAMQ